MGISPTSGVSSTSETIAFQSRTGKPQLLSTRTGLNGTGGFIGAASAGIASRIRHCLPFGCKTIFPIYAGFFFNQSSTEVPLLRGLGLKQIWVTTLTPNPNSTTGVLANPTIANGGSGYAASSTFNVTLAGGTQTLGAAVVSVSTNGSGVVTTVNSVVNIGYYTANPATTNSPTGGTGTGLQLTCAYSKCGDLLSQSTNSENTVVQAYNADLRSGALSVYIDNVIDLGTTAESTLGSGLWPPSASYDAIHPTVAQHAIIAARITNRFSGVSL